MEIILLLTIDTYFFINKKLISYYLYYKSRRMCNICGKLPTELSPNIRVKLSPIVPIELSPIVSDLTIDDVLFAVRTLAKDKDRTVGIYGEDNYNVFTILDETYDTLTIEPSMDNWAS